MAGLAGLLCTGGGLGVVVGMLATQRLETAHAGAVESPSRLPALMQAEPAIELVVGNGGVAFANDHVLVQLAKGIRVTRDARGAVMLRGSTARNEKLARQTLAAVGVTNVRTMFVEPPKDAATAQAIGLDRWYRCDLAANADALAAVARLSALAGIVERAEVDPEGALAEVPNDTDFWVQYALQNTGQIVGGQAGTPGADIGMTTAWNFTHGDPDIVIAVLDSGIDSHPEIVGRILPGINIPDGNTSTADECNHGTHVAGILAATGNNGTGMAGVTWNAKLLPVVVVNGCTGFEADVASGLTWAVDQGARIVNMSLQFNLGSTVFQQAVQYAHAQGALMCAATGNSNSPVVAFPARWNETIAVASTDNRDIRSTFSNYGAEVDVCAPGTNVWSLTSGGGGYTLKNGTSMSTPHVAGVAALIWSQNPYLTRDEVRAIILSTVHDLGAPGFDNYYGFGRLDAAAALAAVPPAFAPQDFNHDGVVNAADLSLLLASWGVCGDCDGGCPADLDGDCFVGAPDLSLFLAGW